MYYWILFLLSINEAIFSSASVTFLNKTKTNKLNLKKRQPECLCCPCTTSSKSTIQTTSSSTTESYPLTTTSITEQTTRETPIIYNELNCVFPFEMFGKNYDNCATFDQGNTYWCSLDAKYTNKAAKCEEKCPLLARNLMVNDPNQVHSACLQPNSDALELKPNDIQIQIILDLHNKIRSTVDPPSSNMREIFWDNGLSHLAQRWAEYCVFDHDCFNCRTLLNNQSVIVGQNAYALFGGQYDSDSFWQDVLSTWAQEKSNFAYGIGATTGNFMDVGHYTQLINADSSKIGCGAAKCGDQIQAFCNYAIGQSDISQPYLKGSSCSRCSSKNCVNNLCSCDKICQNNGILDLASCTCNCYQNFGGALCEINI